MSHDVESHNTQLAGLKKMHKIFLINLFHTTH